MDSLEDSPELIDQESDNPNRPEGSGHARRPGSKAPGRKRTKTGCLTCRKRRIKCGEERPTCHNCTKSKRDCEGYNQRVVFKDPLSSYRPSFAARSHQSANHRNAQAQQSTIVPDPPNLVPGGSRRSKPTPKLVKPDPPSAPAFGPSSSEESNNYAFQDGVTQENYPKMRRPPQSLDFKFDTVDRSHLPEPTHDQIRKGNAGISGMESPVKEEQSARIIPAPVQSNPQDWSDGFTSAPSLAAQEIFQAPNAQFPASSSAFYQQYSTTGELASPQKGDSISSISSTSGHARAVSSLRPGVSDRQKSLADLRIIKNDDLPQRDNTTFTNFRPTQSASTNAQIQSQNTQNYMEADDEDPWDISDEDTPMDGYEGNLRQDVHHNNHLESNDLGIQVVAAMRSGQQYQDVHPRSIMDYINRPDMLASYVPSPQSTPLSDPVTARIFCHFINVTGPCMSMFERHPANPSLIFQGRPVPASQQHIWTYTFPTMALQNPALLHAMLAIASLHIARLQDGPVTASLKHYAIGLRRVGKLINTPAKRKQPATLAAALLLAFYEVWCADHQKWANHVLGARQLVREIDFAGMSKHIRQSKLQRRDQERIRHFRQQQGMGHNFYDDVLQNQENVDKVDENLVSVLMGTKIQYDNQGWVVDQSAQVKDYSQKELEEYEIQRDLFWWYCKQDIYQSILGAGPLFMDYNLWSSCPPRAPIGRLNATYGSYDHLLLLFGRLADFANKDAKRKRLQIKANGGWRPPEGNCPPPSDAGPSHSQPERPFPQPGPPHKPPQMPDFPGMLPHAPVAQLPMGFGHQSASDSPLSNHSDEQLDLAHQLHDALEEWEDIRNAFSILADHFGPDFTSLGPEYSTPIPTPFGPALQYRTYGIAGIWLNYYMALIVCHRSHPSMPPAAMMAAGFAARQTNSYANEIGRIAMGIAPGVENLHSVAPGVGAALIETTTCLFISGVQYQDAAQRESIIIHLHSVARLTGWQTALAISTGCESSWVKVAQMGKGPPYTRFKDRDPESYPVSSTASNNTSPIVPTNFQTSAKWVMAGEKVDMWHLGRRLDRALAGKNEDARKDLMREGGMVHYALGVLGVESDFEKLGLIEGEGAEGERVEDGNRNKRGEGAGGNDGEDGSYGPGSGENTW